MRIEILGTPFNGLGAFPDIENPAEGLRQANLMSLLEAERAKTNTMKTVHMVTSANSHGPVFTMNGSYALVSAKCIGG